MKKLCVVFIVMVLALVSNAIAKNDTSTGSYLLKSCSIAIKINSGDVTPSNYDYMRSSICLGIMSGTLMANQVEQSMGNTELLYCIPYEVTSEQLARVTVKYLKEHPESLHKHQQYLIATAFMQAFPCKKEAMK